MDRAQGFDGLDVHVHLPLVITRAASIEIAIANARLKGRAFPKVQRIRRLDVVMSVAEHGGFAWSMKPVCVDERVLARGNDLNVFQSRALKAFGYELGGTRDVVFVF